VEMIQFDKHIFQMGWNHQPGMDGYTVIRMVGWLDGWMDGWMDGMM